MILNIEHMLIHNPFDYFSLFFCLLYIVIHLFKLQLSWKHTKKNLPALAWYYSVVKIKNNERSFIVCTTPSLGLNMSDCLQALAVNARKAVTSRLQILGKLQYIWLIWIWTCISEKVFKFFKEKNLQKEEVKVRYPTTLFLHLKMTQH